MIPDYELFRHIGGGSYGEVWLARDVLGNYRAVKVVYRNQFSEARPFDREFEGIRNFEPVSRTHPSQVSLFPVGRNEAGGYFYSVLELADDQQTGQQIDPDRYEPKTLRSELVQRARLPVAECVEVGLALTTALKHLHGAGLIHRDIKPSNVIFVHGLPKLADIGLVAGVGEQCSFVGTEGYVANEGPGKVQADIYALGKVLYEMLTGLKPERYPSLPDDFSRAPDRHAQDLNEVVVKACAGNVRERYQSAAEMGADLEFLKSGKSLLRVRNLERAYRRLLVSAGATIAALVLGGLVFGFFLFRNRAVDQKIRSDLRNIEIARKSGLASPWLSNQWHELKQVAAIRADPEFLAQASAMLACFDAKPLVKRHDVSASFATFSPNGLVLLSGLGDSPAMLMDTNGEITRLPVNGEGPVGWSADGGPLQLIAISNGCALRNPVTAKLVREFSVPETVRASAEHVFPLALAPNGSAVAAGGGDRVFVWSATTGVLLGTVAMEASAMSFNADASLLGVGAEDGSTHILALPNLAEVVRLMPASRPSQIRCLAFGRDCLVPYEEGALKDNWLLATGDQRGEIIVWDLRRRAPRSICRGSPWGVRTLAFHPDGLMLFSVGQGQGWFWDVARGEKIRLLSVGSGPGRFAAFNAKGDRLVCGAEPGAGTPAVASWELEFDRGIHVMRGFGAAARKVWFSPDSQSVAALSDDWHWGVWDVQSGRPPRLFDTPVGSSADNAGGCFDASGDRFAFGTWTEACLFDVARGTVLKRWPLKEGFADQMQFDAQGRLLWLRRERRDNPGSSLWRLYQLTESSQPALLHEQRETNWSAADMAFAPGGRHFLVWDAGPDETPATIRAIDVVSGLEAWKAQVRGKGHDLRVCLDPKGSSFAYWADQQEWMKVVRFSDFSVIGRTLDYCQAIAPDTGELRLKNGLWYRPPRGRNDLPLFTDWTHLSYVFAFSPDGKYLAWGTEQGVVLVADLEQVRERIAELRN